MRDEAHLSAVDAALCVDHVEVGGLGLSDSAKGLEIPGIRHEIANPDLRVGHTLFMSQSGHCAQRCQS